ncbi:GTPase domain-containing protein [Falsarthrobacter nasiphocae]|uniref:MinD-like ATPase involved in chromosome partitioning or flagellar assembly n=1 Tax=Falsarthrobacter nasiphocae TaxID=189863 RepID=A0AAE3YHC9_9MICC|nr:GTPase domain-containing protein [Falsarthrobacter nasiphocae]MDR6892234.1 MinD-like ATPase involved in chromosome partitioning or flagellar assembly [Falsarthrobacter nasiphocae]
MASRRAGDRSFLQASATSLAEADEPRWARYGRLALTAGRAAIHDAYPSELARTVQGAQQPVSTGRRIAVISAGGGAGASTAASLVALALAEVRRDAVGLVDLASLRSGLAPSLLHTAHGGPRASLGSLSVAAPHGRSEFLAALSAEEGRPVVVGASQHEKPLDERGATALVAEFSRHCAVTLVECPPGIDDERTRAVLRRAHTAVLVADMSESGFQDAQALLDAMREDGFDLPVLLLGNERSAGRSSVLRRARRTARETGVAFQGLRHQRRFRSGQPLSLDALPEPVRLEVFRIASTALTLARTGAASS